MARLDDTSMMILSGAAARPDLKAFPLPDGLRANEAWVTKVLKGLVARGLLAGIGATRDDVAWTENEEGGRTTLIVTQSGLHAIGIDPEDGPAEPVTAPATAQKPATRIRTGHEVADQGQGDLREESPDTRPHKRATSAKSGKGAVKVAGKPASPRTAGKGQSKQQIVVSMLRRANGASIAELAAATDWQEHSVRGVLTATVKGRLNLPLISEKGVDGVRRYFIAPLRTSKGRE